MHYEPKEYISPIFGVKQILVKINMDYIADPPVICLLFGFTEDFGRFGPWTIWLYLILLSLRGKGLTAGYLKGQCNQKIKLVSNERALVGEYVLYSTYVRKSFVIALRQAKHRKKPKTGPRFSTVRPAIVFLIPNMLIFFGIRGLGQASPASGRSQVGAIMFRSG